MQSRDAVSEGQDYFKGYIKGYEDGLNQAWDDLIGLTTRGYSPREIQVMAKSKRSSIGQNIKDKKRVIRDQNGVDLFEKVPARRAAPRIAAGRAYIVQGTGVERAVNMFSELTSEGGRGLCITRRFPGDYQAAIGPGTTSYWLTRQENGESASPYPCISPSDMGRMITLARGFMKEAEGGVVLLEGTEYLIVQNDLNNVLKFLQSMVDLAITSRSILLLAINPSAVDQKVMSNLECNTAAVL